MENIFLDELNNNCKNKDDPRKEIWTVQDLPYIKAGDYKSYCRGWYSDYTLCDSCKFMQVQIRNYYSGIDITKMNEMLFEMENKLSKI